MDTPKTLPLNWQGGDVGGWRISLVPLDSLGFQMEKYGARADAPDEEGLEQFADSLASLVRETVIQHMKRVYLERDKEVKLTLD